MLGMLEDESDHGGIDVGRIAARARTALLVSVMKCLVSVSPPQTSRPPNHGRPGGVDDQVPPVEEQVSLDEKSPQTSEQ